MDKQTKAILEWEQQKLLKALAYETTKEMPEEMEGSRLHLVQSEEAPFQAIVLNRGDRYCITIEEGAHGACWKISPGVWGEGLIPLADWDAISRCIASIAQNRSCAASFDKAMQEVEYGVPKKDLRSV